MRIIVILLVAAFSLFVERARAEGFDLVNSCHCEARCYRGGTFLGVAGGNRWRGRFDFPLERSVCYRDATEQARSECADRGGRLDTAISCVHPMR